jgi:hypothetical protein
MTPLCVFADWDAIWPILVVVGGFSFAIAAPFAAMWQVRAGCRRLEAIKADVLALPGATTAPLVDVEFHTYHGILLFTVETRHELQLSPEAAEILLKRFRRFNVMWGLLSHACPFVLLGSEYRAALRSIFEQQKRWVSRARFSDQAPDAD